MIRQSKKLIIGFITYGKSTAKYLPYFLPSLKNQTFNNYDIIAFDNTEKISNENIDCIKNNYPEIKILRAGENIGFARAYNKMINKAVETEAEYFLAINPDMILEPDTVGKMVEAMDNHKELGSVCPKILRWDFPSPPDTLPLRRDRGAKCRTNIIDSCGIQEISALRFKDVGQGEIDRGQYDNAKILGPSGATAMYCIDALKKIKNNNEYFDELMFMYKEDCDLAYRLMLAGYKSKLIPEAVIYHDRTARAKGDGNLQIALNRKTKSRQVKKWSFLGQQIIFIKYWRLQNWKDKLAIIWHEFRMLIFILLFEQYLLVQYKKLWKIKKKIQIYQ